MDERGTPVEQVDLRRIVELAHREFDKGLLSTNAKYLLWGSFSSADELVQRFLQAKGLDELADRRRTARTRTQQENDRLEWIEAYAAEAQDYVTWARENQGQPILREALVTYCTLFEGCLKNVSLAFRLAAEKQRGLDDRVFIPGDQYRRALKAVKSEWLNSASEGQSRARTFFRSHVLAKNPDPASYPASLTEEVDWQRCDAAFHLRNAVVHQMSRPSLQVELGGSVFSPGWPIELRQKDLQVVESAMRSVMHQFGPFAIL